MYNYEEIRKKRWNNNLRFRKRKWSDEILTEFEDIILSNEIAKYKGRWNEVFSGEDAIPSALPLYLEIGTGKGKFISEIAADNFDKANFVGLEAKAGVLYLAAKKIMARELTNVKLLTFDAENIIDLFAYGEVDRIYINFCDPWPKKRHAKRRLTYRDFLEKYKIILCFGGEIFFKTDNEELFEFSLNEVSNFGAQIKNISLDLYRNDGQSSYAENVMTEYETKFNALGQKIYRAEFVL